MYYVCNEHEFVCDCYGRSFLEILLLSEWTLYSIYVLEVYGNYIPVCGQVKVRSLQRNICNWLPTY